MAGSKAVQVLEVLKKISDESHAVTQAELLEAMRETGDAATDIPAVLSHTVDEILRQINPVEYTKENEAQYRIKYRGYRENLLDVKEEIKELKKEARRKGADRRKIEERRSVLPAKAPSITDLRYIHDFTDEEMDQMIRIISFSDCISAEEKTNLIGKITDTASIHYETPFYDRKKRKLKFNLRGIFARTYRTPEREAKEKRADSGRQVSFIQKAINDGVRIGFRFNDYDADKNLVPRKLEYELNPYHIVVYHDMYYLIGNRPGMENLSHYRIDLMSEIRVLTDDKGEHVKRTPMAKLEGVREMGGTWNPVKYMSEHLYMGYDKPKHIRIKIPKDQYTVLHDWFGDHYRKLRVPCEEGFDYVDIVTSPAMIVHWAMQYAGIVEIMDEEIREKIRGEIGRLQEKYGE
ncbi:WYL domain-containing protein [Lachnospiraceae bacterium 38-10]